MLLTIASFVFVLGVLIFIHELGHFLVAKKVGIRVDKFSLGFPPNIFSKKYGETTYCIGAIPLGGFVKMAGENPDEESTGSSDEFMSKGVGQRAAVIFAGPFMNYVLAVVLMIGIVWATGDPIYDNERVVVSLVEDGDPASLAGILVGDEIVEIDGNVVDEVSELSSYIHARPEQEIGLLVVRAEDTIALSLTTKRTEMPNMDGGIDTIGLMGVSLGQKVLRFEPYTLFESVQLGFVKTHQILGLTLDFFQKLITFQVSGKMVGGPIFIAQQSGRSAKQGPVELFFFMAMLSINLAIINLMPFPVLDGGHLVFLAIEKIKGSPLSMKARMAAQQVGVVVLLGGILIVTYNDIVRVFTGF